jgi:endonuclease/exonuclease/phosphatase family metal-dependent hydrolase
MSASECTVVTLNIFHDLPAFRQLHRRCELIAQAIAARRPHVVALQEIVRSTTSGDIGARIRDTVNRLCGGELYRLDYAAADGAGEGEFSFDEGLALLSRLEPVAEAESIRYRAQVEMVTEVAGHRYRLPDDRIAIRRRFRLDNGSMLDFYVSHLTDRPEAVEGIPIRALQARELAQWAAGAPHPHASSIVAGDFNDVAGSEAIASLIGAGFIDLHAAFGEGPGYTNDRNDIALDAERATHNQRIDYLMLRPRRGDAPTVREVGLFADRPHREPDGSWLWLSDHIGVIATVLI